MHATFFTRILLVAVCSYLLVTSMASAAGCDAEFVNAFRRKYQYDVHEITAHDLYQRSCSTSTNDSGVKLQLPNAGLYGGTKSQVMACASHDEKYFRDYADKSVSSFLDADVAKAILARCSRDVEFVGSEDSSGIVLTAYFTPSGDGHRAWVRKNIGMLPENGATLRDTNLAWISTERNSANIPFAKGFI
jgi:hypothetical protein